MKTEKQEDKYRLQVRVPPDLREELQILSDSLTGNPSLNRLALQAIEEFVARFRAPKGDA